MRYGLYVRWGRSLNFSFWIISEVDAVWGWVLSWCKTNPFVHISQHLLWIAGFNSSSSLSQYQALLNICLSMILVMPNDGPNITLPAEGTLLNFLGVGDDMCFHSILWHLLAGLLWYTHVSLPVTVHCKKASPLQYHCRNCMHTSTCAAHLCSSVSCFGTHLAQILWYPRCSWMTEYVDPQLVSNLLTIWVTVICLFFWTRALTCTLSVIHEVVRWPKQPSSTVLVLPLQNFYTHWYSFLCVIQVSPYCANILLWILEGLTLCDHKNQMTTCCLTVMQSESRDEIFTLW
jgi:hypothetical protein